MKKNIIKYLLIALGIVAAIIIYLSLIGIETDKFNGKIKDKISQNNNQLDIQLKKIKLTLDPLNFKINAKTIGTKIIYQKKTLELESIKIKMSLNSLIKNKFVSSNLIISTRSVLLKDLVGFLRATTNRTELFFLEKLIEKGYAIIDLELNFNENGDVKKDYKIKGLLKDGKISLLNDYNFENINFLLNIENDNFNFRKIKFTTNNIDFFSDSLKIKKNKKEFFVEGNIENKNSKLNDQLLNLIRLNFDNINFENIKFSSKNNFSFNVNNKINFKNLVITSEIIVDETNYKKPNLLNDYFSEVKDIIYLKDHKIKVTYKKDNLSLKGSGKIQLEKDFDEIDYTISKIGDKINFDSNIKLSELKIKNQKNIKTFFPEIKEIINLKDHQVNIKLIDNDLSFKGSGKIQLEKDFDEIDYTISKIGDKINFDSNLTSNKTSFQIDSINYKKDKDSKLQLTVSGNYEKTKGLALDQFTILAKDDQINLKNLLIDRYKKIIKFDELNLDYFDADNKRNKFILKRKQKNNYELNGSTFNANRLITDLLKSKDDSKIFKSDVNLSLNLTEVYVGDKDIVNNLKGKLNIRDNKVFEADISGLFDKNESLTFTINTNNDEKITTLFSSRAKPIVKRYKFIKGYEEGYLDFYSSKKDDISRSKLNIYNFKLQKLPALTKLLTLASLQGIADTLSGEGIRFNEFEMNFNNKDSLMTIDEIYAIGPAISILMSGYVDEDKLISLRGTLVPATTINKSIGSIPLLGKILVGDKTGEGVFGVSFKIKGPPKNLETTVNPVKTLTPRFITRTLEKIKKN